ncbi:aflatoxin efflux pump [Arthroderma uncinatum]|uniref:aflatoxin efflux pump n=1 Tax=Arthroderma uncinatum TaxID=74035 RepID=UPI00144AD1AD|nr:aflatoxin efflux pump [Arthroderma uncinatum]KAF3490686.1 aflatoxin efflux pump [Arthroderma uncinatum]
MPSPSSPYNAETATDSSIDVEKSAADMPVPNAKPEPPKPTEKTFSLKVILLLISVLLCMFLVGLDRTIVSTAVPTISNEFNAFSDIGWYGSVYSLTCCAFQLAFGKIYAYFSVRATFFASMILFEAGSALSGAAPSSIAFILGRAIAGVGAAGIFAGTIMAVVYAVPLARRPQIQGLMGAVMGVATILGPLIGGTFTTKVTWRWCFYINLPFGAVAMVAAFFLFDVPDRDSAKLPLAKKLAQLDAPGTALVVPGVACLLLALQWGGQTYAWDNGRIIALLVLAAVLLIAFVASQFLLPKTATIPPSILKLRSVAGAAWATICIGSSQYIFVYYLPIWFQAIKNVAAVDSGIRLLPMMVSVIVAQIGGGFINQKIGYYTPLGIFGVTVMCVGAGLLTTLQVDSSEGSWIGYQILYGIGMGFCFQTSNLATQTVLPKPQVPIGMALMFFGQLLGAAVFVSVGENVLSNQLQKRLSKIPGYNPAFISSAGATTLIDSVPPELRGVALSAYNESLRRVFQIGLVMSCLGVLGIYSLEWKSVKKPGNPGAGGPGGPRGSGSTSSDKPGEEKKVAEPGK